jgi:hypothetical protein
MKLSVKGLTWGLAFFMLLVYVIIGVINIFYPGYGADYLNFTKTFYPGYTGTLATTKDVIVGGAYFFVDGLILGLLFALCYNAFAGKAKAKKAAPRRAAAKRPAPKKRPAAKKKKAAGKKRPAKRKR